ncbi:MAG: ion channel [Burkholderiaceae bacterium]|nr:ion channel [Burkholderiaceae bacterium]
MSSTHARRLPALPRRHKYKVLLALLLTSIVIQTYGMHAGFTGLLSDIFRTVMFVTIFFVVFRGTRERVPAAVLLLVVVLVGWTRHFTGAGNDGALALAFNALLALFLWTAVAVILRDLFRTPEAGAGNVLGAICGFLIAADAWTGIHICAYLLAPHSLAFDPGVQDMLGHWHSRLGLFCYYSFAQMTMLGYGDVTPVRAPATTLSLFAALFGMFYTAVVVAQFVGLAQGGSGDAASADGKGKP